MRRKDRQITDKTDIAEIIKKCTVLHLGMCDKNKPYVVPLSFGFEERDGKYCFYMHCADEGRKLDDIKANPTVFAEGYCENRLVEAQDACGYSCTFESFMAEGIAEIISDTKEKKHALSVLMKHQTGKAFTFDERMTRGVTVIRMTAERVTAKAKRV